ncbi:unnamed protein product, partial [Peniophora sp. CBMAI 1063]
MTSAAPRSTTRRFSQVYVNIPPSPYRRDSRGGVPKTPSDENMPEDANSNLNDKPTSIKRKRDNGDGGGQEPKKKRAKVDGEKGGEVKGGKDTKDGDGNEQYPNGYFHCHQCVQKRDTSEGLQCTYRSATGAQGRRCKLKYCRTCLKNRYGLDIDALRARHPRTLQGKELVEYVTDVEHVFKCPRCTKICNCRTCRKAAGLPPTGNLTVTMKRTGADSVAAMLANNKNLTEAQAKELAPPPPPKPKPTKSTTANAKASSSNPAPAPEAKPKRAYTRKPKPAPQPLWSPLPLPSSFTLPHALSRAHIHDFVLRFCEFFPDVNKGMMDELGEVGGRGGKPDEEEGGGEGEEVDVGVRVGWVSEGCLRGVLLGLLALAVDAEGVEDDKDTMRAFKAASLGIRNAGSSLHKQYAALLEVSDVLALPDPLAPPALRSRMTRSEMKIVGQGEVNVVCTAQMVRVVERMIEVCMRSKGVKGVMDECANRMAEAGREERERRREEKERWEGVKKDCLKSNKNPTKEDRDIHNAHLASLTHSLSIAHQSLSPRFAPLGTDHAGRTYVVLAPSAAERDAALEVLGGTKSANSKRRGRGGVREEERRAMKRWGWFVGVYGGLPEGARVAREDDDEGEGDG